MEVNKQYIICPDKDCKKFWDEEDFACNGSCPQNCKMYIVCPACGNKVYFNPKDTSQWQRIDCTASIGNGFTCGGCSFARMSGKYELEYEL